MYSARGGIYHPIGYPCNTLNEVAMTIGTGSSWGSVEGALQNHS